MTTGASALVAGLSAIRGTLPPESAEPRPAPWRLCPGAAGLGGVGEQLPSGNTHRCGGHAPPVTRARLSVLRMSPRLLVSRESSARPPRDARRWEDERRLVEVGSRAVVPR